MDPQQRLLLHSLAELRATERTSPSPSIPTQQQQQQQQQQLGVFVGVSQLEYARVCLEHNAPLTAYYATGVSCVVGMLLDSDSMLQARKLASSVCEFVT